MASIKPWVNAKLAEMLGFEQNGELATYLLNIKDQNDLTEYLTGLLGDTKTTRTFAQDLVRRRDRAQSLAVGPGLRVYRKGDPTPRESAGLNNARRTPQTNHRSPPRAQITPAASPKPQTIQRPAHVIDKTHKKAAAAASARPTAAQGAADGAALRRCSCQATVHGLVNNCLGCGRIICEYEYANSPDDNCVFCGTALEEGSVGKKRQKKKKRLAAEASRGVAPLTGQEGGSMDDDEARAGLEAAIRQKERLLEFDRGGVARSRVYDDQGDYFSDASSAWLSPAERELALTTATAREEAVAKARRETRITFDIAGRRVAVEKAVEPQPRDAQEDIYGWQSKKDGAAAAAPAAAQGAAAAGAAGAAGPGASPPAGAWVEEDEAAASSGGGGQGEQAGDEDGAAWRPRSTGGPAPLLFAGVAPRARQRSRAAAAGSTGLLSNRLLTGKAAAVYSRMTEEFVERKERNDARQQEQEQKQQGGAGRAKKGKAPRNGGRGGKQQQAQHSAGGDGGEQKAPPSDPAVEAGSSTATRGRSRKQRHARVQHTVEMEAV